MDDYSKLVEKASESYHKHRTSCDMVAKLAQKYIDWDDSIGCDYFPGDGVCITTKFELVCRASVFFIFIHDHEIKYGEKVSYDNFNKLCI